MNEPQSWVKPLTRIPSSLKPLVATQKKHYGDVLHPTRWWGRMPFLFWLVALLSGFWSVKGALNAGDARAVDDPRFSGLPLCFLC